MVGIYFSCTGNTKYCVTKFVKSFDEQLMVVSIENDNITELIKENDTIVFGYLVYFSNLPKIVSYFVELNAELFKDKKVFIIAPMGFFSGDGSGILARKLKSYGSKIIGWLHIVMPDCIGDNILLKKSIKKI